MGLLHEDKTFTFCEQPIAKIKNKMFKLNICTKAFEISKEQYDCHVTGLDHKYYINYFSCLKHVNGKLEHPGTFPEILKDTLTNYIKWNK